ncbi:hypothetical protein [Actinoplanes sp. NPDC051494]|uniref:hypothetical protein n=1 Tax=Actinoplanes sp. NPDC051494 TaxID=3363907 RepID=UPI0037968243
MTQQPWDDVLLAELREALAEEPLPPDFAEAARAAFAWRTIDEELTLLEMSFDSQLPTGALATRSGAATRLLVFEGEGYRIDAELDPGPGLTGQLTPPSAGTVHCQSAHGTSTAAPIGETGAFTVDVPTHGAVRLRLQLPARTVVTGWIGT